MKRRCFLATGLGAVVAGTAMERMVIAGAPAGQAAAVSCLGGDDVRAQHPRDIKLCVKPVMTNVIHSAAWQGPCRWTSPSPDEEKAAAESWFAGWSRQLKADGLGRAEDVRLLEPVHVTFSEDWEIKPDQVEKLRLDADETDVYFIISAGNARGAYEIGDMFGKPIVLDGLNCRNISIAGYTLAKGHEVHVAGEDLDLTRLLSLLRARKVFRHTRILYPTDGVPSFSPDTVWDFEDLEKRLGVSVVRIGYREMSAEMDRLMADEEEGRRVEQAAAELVRNADKVHLDKSFVWRSLMFDRCIRNLMAQHGCNAFTIDCFEFCPSLLPQQWLVVPCLLHALFGNEGIASACEADLGILLAVRLLMSVSNKSCHQGNGDALPGGTFCVNHSAPSMKMNGMDQPDVPYQLGRFVEQGWGTKVVVDFMNNQEKTVTVARVDPTATKLLVCRGTLVGSSGWDQDNLGCSVVAVIQPPPDQSHEFLRRRMIYGNHLQWVYGDYTRELKILGEMLGLTVEVFA